jgi:GDP-4-dehydro-6-deoxy-D-mannose reductase
VASPSRSVLVTGAAGFAGRHLIDELERETSWGTIGVARTAGTAGARTRVLACDLRDADLVRRVVKRHRPDVVFHLAAQSFVPQSFAAPADTLLNNIVSELNVLEACRELVPDAAILIVSSAEVYGTVQPEDLPVRESQPFLPANPYAVSKIAQDMLGLQYAIAYGSRVVRVRPFNHFGPGQNERFVLSSFARQIAQAELGRIEPVLLTGDTSVARDFLDVRDVVRAYRLAVERGQPGEVYNVARGQAYVISSLLGQLLRLSTVAIEVRQDPARLRRSDVEVLYGDASRLTTATGWQPVIPIAQSLSDTLEYWRAMLGGPGGHATIERP